MKSGKITRCVVAILLLSVGLSLSSCVVYDPGPYYHDHDHHDRDHERDHDRWR